MKTALCVLMVCLLAPALAQPVSKQPVPRIKAKLLAFDGHVMTLQPLTAPVADAPKRSPVKHGHAAPANEAPSPPADAKPADAAPPANLTVAVLPDTRYVTAAPSTLDTIKPGDFAGAAVTGTGNNVEGQSVLAYPEALKGSGEGRFPDPLTGRMMINGLVMAVSASSLTLHYRGSVQNGPVCEGRAPPRGIAGPLTCSADAVVHVAAETPVRTLVIGDQSLLVPGAELTVSMAKNTEGDNVTPGVIVEKAPAP